MTPSESVLVLSGYVVLYATQYFLGRSPTFAQWCRAVPWPAPAAEVLGRNALGFVALGVVPILLSPLLPARLADYGLRAPGVADLRWTLGAGAVVFLLVWASARWGAVDPLRPQVRPPHWTTALVLWNAGGWLVYLAGYELALRGFVLFGCVRDLGIGPAVAVNLAIYVFVHLPLGPRETAVSIPFGLLACAAALTTGSMWVPFALHAIAAITNDTTRARRQS
jgi:membrane protease YdiL (CAAX protease family)